MRGGKSGKEEGAYFVPEERSADAFQKEDGREVPVFFRQGGKTHSPITERKGLFVLSTESGGGVIFLYFRFYWKEAL